MKDINILIADDVDYIVEFMMNHLKKVYNNASFIRAKNGYEVYTLAVQHKPDIILLDWEMPEFSGMDALLQLKNHKDTLEIPVIMVSGFTQPDLVKKAFEAGAIDYLKKPIEPDELLARVRTAMTLANTLCQLKIQKRQLEVEKQKTDTLLKGLLPKQILDSMKLHGKIAPKRFKNVTIVYADLVDFTIKSQKMSPKRLIDELKTIFTAFDKIVESFDCTRIKTVGDAYIAVCGMWDKNTKHAIIGAKMAEDMRQYIIDHNEEYRMDWEIRIGINSGDIIAGFISKNNLSYDIFGDTVNTASRMQVYSNPMQINLSQSTYELIKDHYSLIKRISRKVKGKGSLNMYYLHRPINKNQ